MRLIMNEPVMSEMDRDDFIEALSTIKHLCDKSGEFCFTNCPFEDYCPNQSCNFSAGPLPPSHWNIPK